MSDEFINKSRVDALNLYKIQKCGALAHNQEKLEERKQYLKMIYNKLN